MLAARAAALEEKVEEGRAEQGQVTSLRQLAAEAEAARARVEDEVLATARIATGLEARLRTARAEAEAAQRDTLAANERCSQVPLQPHKTSAHACQSLVNNTWLAYDSGCERLTDDVFWSITQAYCHRILW